MSDTPVYTYGEGTDGGFGWGTLVVVVAVVVAIFVVYLIFRDNTGEFDVGGPPTVNGVVSKTIIDGNIWEVSLHTFPSYTFWHENDLGFGSGENIFLWTLEPSADNRVEIVRWEYADGGQFDPLDWGSVG